MSDARDVLKKEGVLVLKGFFQPEEFEGWTAEYYRVQGEIGQAGSPLQRSDRFVSGIIPPPLGDIYLNHRLVSLMVDVIGPDVALYMNRFMLKDSAWSGPVHIHIDLPYFHGGADKISVFVPVTKQSAEDGTLFFFKKSHLYGNLGRGTINPEAFPPLEKLHPELDVGDIILMDFCTWHGSDAPTRQTERGIMQIAFQPATDGSYQGSSVAAPTLVAGGWRTEAFSAQFVGISD